MPAERSRSEHQMIRGTPRRWPRALLLALLALGATGLFAAPASAVIVTLKNGKTLSYQPLRGAARALARRRFDALFANLDYNGGPVMPSNTNYTVYWHPSGAPAYPAKYQEGVNRYLEDLAHDSGGHENVDSVSTQYNDAEGEFAKYESTFGGALIDTHPYPKNGCTRAAICLTDAQIQAELTSFVKEHKLPTDLTHEYFLLTPPKVESCFEAAGFACSAGAEHPEYCAYHGNIPTEGGQLIYANDPYVSGNGGCDDGNHPNESPSDGALEGGLSHEHNESITDPQPNSAWTDFGSAEGGEVGDKCAGETGEQVGETKTGMAYNQVINGHFYWYQEEWSNQTHSCLQRFTFSGEPPTAKFTLTPGNGREMVFNAEGSTASGGVYRYNWQFNDTGEPGEPLETPAPTAAHVFPADGTYTVALTVFASNGTSIGTARTFEIKAPTAAFTVTPPSPNPGQSASFDGSASTANAGSISKYEWTFGDGSSGEGATPTHAYATAGLYEATLTVSNTAGFNASISHLIDVVSPGGGSGGSGGTGAGGGGTGSSGATTGPGTQGAPTLGGLSPVAIAAAPSASVALAASTLTVQGGGQSAVKLTCTGTAACAGELTLMGTQRVKHGGRTHTRTVTLASARFSIPAGATTAVKLKLGSTGRRLLHAAGGHLGATLHIRKSAPAPVLTLAKPVRLLLARSHGH